MAREEEEEERVREGRWRRVFRAGKWRDRGSPEE
jgi:hypothetical protein